MIEWEVACPGERKALAILPRREDQTVAGRTSTSPSVDRVPKDDKVCGVTRCRMKDRSIRNDQIATADCPCYARRADGHVDAGH